MSEMLNSRSNYCLKTSQLTYHILDDAQWTNTTKSSFRFHFQQPYPFVSLAKTPLWLLEEYICHLVRKRRRVVLSFGPSMCYSCLSFCKAIPATMFAEYILYIEDEKNGLATTLGRLICNFCTSSFSPHEIPPQQQTFETLRGQLLETLRQHIMEFYFKKYHISAYSWAYDREYEKVLEIFCKSPPPQQQPIIINPRGTVKM